MAESEEELKSLLIRVKEKSEKASLRLNISKKKKDHGSSVLFPVAQSCPILCNPWTVARQAPLSMGIL